ncbi:hypothetical protein DR950_36135 [Kitasatospora xanthocidica]|uniref:Capsid protein n=1 Tax=Kitasatospora xanthocidica TaxID=83382 RepID=A0A373A2T0_9ACTN|nr:hypothetical protein [Kitasatospora xanthocidica]RGD62466.1 hypothetical protein DR950_36135 [Kitasatospora xanthocidica]
MSTQNKDLFYGDTGARITDGVKGVFTPEIWTTQLLDDLEDNLILGNNKFTNRSYEGEFHKGGDTIRIPHFRWTDDDGNDIVNDYGMVKAYGKVGNRDHAQLEYMRMTVQKGSSFHLEIDSVDQLFTQPGVDKLSDLIRKRARIQAETIERTLATTLMYATQGLDYNSVEADAVPAAKLEGGAVELLDPVLKDQGDQVADGAVYGAVVDMVTQLDINNAPADRVIAVSPHVYRALLKDPQFIDAQRYGGTPVIPNGHIGSVLGVPILVSNTLGNHDRNKSPLIRNLTSDLNKLDMAAFATDAISLVMPFAEMKAYEPEESFTHAIKSRMFYDAKVIRPEQVIAVKSFEKPTTKVTK